MKQLVGRSLTTLFALVLLWLPMAHAQSTLSIIKVKVPFEFKVGDTVVPAGEYSVVQPMQHFVQLRDARGHVIASAFTRAVESASLQADSQLRFYRAGSQAILSEVWQRGESLGEQLYGSGPDVLTAAGSLSTTGSASSEGQP